MYENKLGNDGGKNDVSEPINNHLRGTVSNMNLTKKKSVEVRIICRYGPEFIDFIAAIQRTYYHE